MNEHDRRRTRHTAIYPMGLLVGSGPMNLSIGPERQRRRVPVSPARTVRRIAARPPSAPTRASNSVQNSGSASRPGGPDAWLASGLEAGVRAGYATPDTIAPSIGHRCCRLAAMVTPLPCHGGKSAGLDRDPTLGQCCRRPGRHRRDTEPSAPQSAAGPGYRGRVTRRVHRGRRGRQAGLCSGSQYSE